MITSEFTTSVGTISITIDDGGTNAFVETEKLGALKYEFDQTPDSVQIDRTIALYSYIQIVFQEQTEASEDVYDRLIENLASGPADATLSIDNFGVDTFDFSFELKQENVDFNQKDGSVTVRLTPKIDQTATISQVIRSSTNYNYQPKKGSDSSELSGTNLNCLPVVDFLEQGMQSVFGNNYESYIRTSKTSSNASYFKSNADWGSLSTGFIIVDPGDYIQPSNSSFYNEPTLLSITANVSTEVIVSGPSFGGAADLEKYDIVTKYYIEQTNILSSFASGTAIGWFADEEVVGPKRIDFTQSSTNTIRIGDITSVLIQFVGDPAPPAQSKTVILSDAPIYVYNANVNRIADEAIKEIAGIEGAIFGSGFSKNFYVHRLADNNTEYVTLKYDLVSDVKQKKLSKYLSSAIVRQIADYQNTGLDQFGKIPHDNSQNILLPNLSGTGSFIRGNENATKSLDINIAPVYPYLNKAIKKGSDYEDSIDSVLETAITSAGVRAYMQSLNQQSGGLKIELTYLSALALKPYELFQFDSTAPEKYQNKQYRITSIAYDFVKDETKIVGYQINNLATPIVSQPPPGTGFPKPPPPNEGSSTEVSYRPGWNMVSNPTETPVGFGDQFGEDIVKGSSYRFDGSYSNVSTMNTATFNEGYWVYFKDEVFEGEDSKQYEYSGNIFSSNVVVSVDAGWNMIGALGVTTYPVSNTANISNNTLYQFNGSYELSQVMFPGKGYWIYVNNSGEIDLNNQGTQIPIANLQEDFKRVLFTSNDATISVYFDGTNTNTNVNIQTSFYPPAIGNNFDVRINQDETNTALRDLRAVESNTINIDVQQIDAGTTLNIVPKIGDSASSYYQCTFLDGDKIITALNVSENVAVDVPITTTRIQVQPMGASVKLPVRAKDIANDDGELLDTVAIEGASGAIADRVQYLNADGELTELITAGTADFIQAVASRPEFSSKQNNVPSKSQVFLFSYDGTGGLTDNRISGFSGGSAGKLIRVINVGSNSIVLSANDTDSTAGNRILGSNVTLQQYEAATLIYIEDFTGTSPTTTIDGWIIVGRNN